MKTIVLEGNKGFLFKKGKFIKMLEAGEYNSFGKKTYDIARVSDGEIVTNLNTDLNIFTKDKNFVDQTIVHEVKNGQIALHFVNDLFENVLQAGKHYFWNIDRIHSFVELDLSSPILIDNFPKYLLTDNRLIPYIKKVEISDKKVGVLYFDHKVQGLLNSGIYYYLNGNVAVDCTILDTCLICQDVLGQEILTNDKVTLRISCVCNYKITDYIKIVSEIDDYKNQLYIAIQLALRDYIGERNLDTILTSKKELSEYLSSSLKEKGNLLYLDIEDVSVKDIVLPGEIRDIMNTVLIAEKKAQANVITRREEVASTRSLLNTARLMDENATLYKLKELEYVERICEKVGNINLTSGGDILSQLTTVLSSKKE